MKGYYKPTRRSDLLPISFDAIRDAQSEKFPWLHKISVTLLLMEYESSSSVAINQVLRIVQCVFLLLLASCPSNGSSTRSI